MIADSTRPGGGLRQGELAGLPGVFLVYELPGLHVEQRQVQTLCVGFSNSVSSGSDTLLVKIRHCFAPIQRPGFLLCLRAQ